MDWGTLYGPHPACAYAGVGVRESGLVTNGTTRGPRQALCREGQSRVALTDGTPDGDWEHAAALLAFAMRAWAAGTALRATARSVQVDQETSGRGLERAAPPGRRVIRPVWPHRPVRACPWDERWRFGQTPDEPRAGAKRSREPYGEAWGWGALAPAWRVVMACVVGQRTPVEAHLGRERVAQVTTARLPVCTSDQLPAYRTAWRPVSGAWPPPPRRGSRGPPPPPRRVPRPERRDAPVVKTRARGRLVAVEHHGVWGDDQRLAECVALVPTSVTITTSVVAREHRTFRPQPRRLTRQTQAFRTARVWWEKPWW